jgi:hypothetical protein
VFGVVHPTFLVAPTLEMELDTDPNDEPRSSSCHEKPLASIPDDKEELERLVDETLTPVLGHAPIRDEDGDIGVTTGSAMVFVRVLPDQPIVQLFSELAVAVTEPDRASFEVAVLNRDWRFAKFLLVGDTVQAHVYVPACPFAPDHLRQALAMMCQMADAVDDDLAFRVGGRTFLHASDIAPDPGDR